MVGILDDATGIGAFDDPAVALALVVFIGIYGEDAWKLIEHSISGRDKCMS